MLLIGGVVRRWMGIKEMSGSRTIPLVFSNQNLSNCSSVVPGCTE